jgi:hypothetical protein
MSGREHDIGRSFPSAYEKRMRKQQRETREKESSVLNRKISDFFVSQYKKPSVTGETESLSTAKEKITPNHTDTRGST